MENCLELMMEDVVKIDFYQKESIIFAIPNYAPAVQEVEFLYATGATPKLSISLMEDDASDAKMEPAPQINVTEKREAAGVIRSILIEPIITGGFDTARRVVDSVQFVDLVPMIYTVDGQRFTFIPFPNSSMLALTDSRLQSHSMTLRYTAQSYSSLIKAEITTDPDPPIVVINNAPEEPSISSDSSN